MVEWMVDWVGIRIAYEAGITFEMRIGNGSDLDWNHLKKETFDFDFDFSAI